MSEEKHNREIYSFLREFRIKNKIRMMDLENELSLLRKTIVRSEFRGIWVDVRKIYTYINLANNFLRITFIDHNTNKEVVIIDSKNERYSVENIKRKLKRLRIEHKKTKCVMWSSPKRKLKYSFAFFENEGKKITLPTLVAYSERLGYFLKIEVYKNNPDGSEQLVRSL